MDFHEWFIKNTGNYLKNSASKLELSRKFTNGILQDVFIYMDTFRGNMKEQFDDPISSHLAEASQVIKDVYIEILNKLIAGEYFFGDKEDLREIASAMNIWRIPVSKNYNTQSAIDVDTLFVYKHMYQGVARLNWCVSKFVLRCLSLLGVGATKASFVNFSVSKIFDFAKIKPSSILFNHIHISQVSPQPSKQLKIINVKIGK